MEYGRSNRAPVLDEDDDDGDVPLPSHIVRDQINLSDLRDTTGDACISDWARRHVGDTHLGKRKFQRGHTKGDSKRQKQKGKATAKSVNSDTSTDDGDGERSPPYQETGDSSSAGDGDGSDGADAAAGGGGGGSGGGIPIRFTGETQFTHATQDPDHGAPESPRRTVGPTDNDTPQYSSSSYSDSRHSFHYPIPDISMEPQTRWVYEWEDPHFYTMLVQEWETTSAWTGQSWQDYKAELLRVRGLNVMSIAEYQMASRMGVFPFLR
ncbi:uncharacterized protein LOC120673745 [Panicum virgatum]|nr:uncharacterized protein LOC120643394 [Panicum virgatum]XP_039808371.1 uncharacterized protein LOC120672140 [Panicum virgatum]XP_039810672.1 uncharacterized protein LOC120673745 [Panicum virgatum]